MNRLERNLLIENKLGLHARAATKLVSVVNQFDAEITLMHEQKTANAASVMGLLLLETCQGQSVQVVAEGPEAEAAMDAVETLIKDKFDEHE